MNNKNKQKKSKQKVKNTLKEQNLKFKILFLSKKLFNHFF